MLAEPVDDEDKTFLNSTDEVSPAAYNYYILEEHSIKPTFLTLSH